MLTTWILVADGTRARLFEHTSPSKTLTEVACLTNPDGRAPGRHASTDRLPRVNESMGSTRHAIEPHTSLREKSTHQFAHTINDALERGLGDHQFDRLVLVASPRFLGALHGNLSKSLVECVAGEFRRNLTALPAQDIHARLPRELLVPGMAS
jgi:protein required for attachment to host cells